MKETRVDETKRDIFLWRTLGWTNSGGCGMWRRIEVGSGQEQKRGTETGFLRVVFKPTKYPTNETYYYQCEPKNNAYSSNKGCCSRPTL